MTSKADPKARHRGIGFKIGKVFSADDPIGRWSTVLAMAANNTIYLNVRLIEGDLPPELSMYYFRLLVAHFFEAAQWSAAASRRPLYPLSEAEKKICAAKKDAKHSTRN